MKAWRIINLHLWGICLFILLAISLGYLLLSHTVLNQSAVRERLVTTNAYEVIQSDIIIPRITKMIEEESPFTSLITREDVRQSLKTAFSTQRVEKISEPALTSFYDWMNKKQPDLAFSVSITEEKQLFLQDLNNRIGAKIKALPSCRLENLTTADISELVCLPPFGSAGDVVQSLTSTLKQKVMATDDAITDKTLGLSGQNLGGFINLPDYAGYWWALNFITLPLAGLITLYLIIKRRGAGLLTVGIVLLFLGIAAGIGYVLLGMVNMPGTALFQAFYEAIIPLIQHDLLLGCAGLFLFGIMTVVSGTLWMKRTKKG